MSLRFVFGSSGAGKSYTLFSEVIRRSLENPGQRFLVIVPEQSTMQTQKELVRLHPAGGILDIDVLSFQRLAYRVFDETGTRTGRVLEETGKNLVLRKLAQEHAGELKVLGGNLKKPGYINEIKSIVSELSQYAVTVDELEELCGGMEERPALRGKLSDILVIYKAFRDYLEGGYVTAEELLEVLCAVAEDSALITQSVIVFDGFTGFTPIQYNLMKKLISCAKEVVVTVTIDPEENPYRLGGDHELFYLSKKTVCTLTRLAEETGTTVEKPVIVRASKKSRFGCASSGETGALFHLERNLFRNRQTPYEDEAKQEIALRLMKDPESEVTFAASEIQRMVRSGGYRYRDFAIITGSMEAYSPLLARILPDYGIPCFIDDKKSVLKNPFVEYIRALLEVASQDLSYESVFRFLRNALSDISPDDVDVLENYVLALGIRGARRWGRPFERLYGKLTAEELEEVNTVRKRAAAVLLPFVEIQKSKDTDVRTRTTALYEFIEKADIQNKLALMEEDFRGKGDRVLAAEYHQIYAIVMDLLDKLVEFLGDEKLSLKEYGEILDAGFAEAKIAVIPPGTDCMIAGDMERTRLNDVKVLYFLGVNEGSVPKSGAGGGLLSDMDRESIKGRGVELAPTAAEKGYIQRFYLYMNLTKPSKKLCISCSALDGDGGSLRPSYLTGVLRKLFPKLEFEPVSSKNDLKEGFIPLNENEAFRTLAEELSRARESGDGSKAARICGFFAGREGCGEKLDALLDAAFDVHEDTRLDRAVAHALYGNVLVNSVTRLEKYASCAYSHFLSYGLRLSEREIYEFLPVDLGNIFHDSLEAFSKKLEESEYSWKSLPEERANEWAEEVMRGICADYGNSVLGSSARDAYTVERMVRMLKRTVLTLKAQVEGGEFVPVGYEVPFSRSLDLDTAGESGSEGFAMRLRGRIDRIDVCEDGDRIYVKVIDYKTGSKEFSLLLLFNGLQLQLPVYLDSALEMIRQKHPGAEVVPAAVLYYRVNDPLLEADAADESLERKLLEELRPDGLVSSDPEVIKRLDTKAEGKSAVIPVTFNKDGSLGKASKTAAPGQLGRMTDFAEWKMRRMGSEILDGHMETSPYELKGERPCGYCEYRGVCGLDPKRGGFKVRRIPVFDDGVIWKLMEDVD